MSYYSVNPVGQTREVYQQSSDQFSDTVVSRSSGSLSPRSVQRRSLLDEALHDQRAFCDDLVNKVFWGGIRAGIGGFIGTVACGFNMNSLLVGGAIGLACVPEVIIPAIALAAIGFPLRVVYLMGTLSKASCE